MFQDSLIEEMPVLLDRGSNSAPNVLADAEVWLDHEIATLEYSLRDGDPDTDRELQPLKKIVKQSIATAPLRCLQSFSVDDAVRRIVIHPDGETLLTVGSPTRNSRSEVTNTVQAWNWRTGDLRFSLAGHLAPITAMALSQTGILVTGSRDRTIKAWNVSTGEELTTLKGHHSPITAVAISADGQTVVSSGCNSYEIRDRHADLTVRDRALRIWNLPQGKNTHILPCLTDVPSLAICGESLLKIEPQSAVVNLQSGETRSSLNWLSPCEQWLAITPDWQHAATLIGRQVMIRNGTSGEVRCQIPLDLRDRALHVAALSPDGKWFVAGFQRTDVHPKLGSYLTRQNVLRIWDAETGESLGSLSQADLGQGLWQSVKFNQQSRLLVTSVGSRLKVWQCDR